MARRASLFLMVTSIVLIAAGCDQQAADNRLLGIWVAGSQTLVFKPNGQFAIRKDGVEQGGTWEPYGPEVLLKVGGKDMMCNVQSRFENQLMVRESETEPRGCTLASYYWRFDLPAEKRAEALVVFHCQTQGQTVGPVSYTKNFTVEADKNDNVACFGKTSTGCQFVWRADLVSDAYFSNFISWGNGTGDNFEIRPTSDSRTLELLQGSSQSCSIQSGMQSCQFSSATQVGTCRKVAP